MLEGLTLKVDCFTGILDNGSAVVRDISFDVKQGEFVGIMGPSSSGKSSLLKFIMNILPKHKCSGDIVWTQHGRPIAPGQLNRYVKYVPLKDFAYPALTVAQNLEYQIALRDGFQDMSNKVGETLKIFGLDDCASNFVGFNTEQAISSGERRRLNLALEYTGRSRGVVLDEPTSGVDVANARRVAYALRDLAVIHESLVLTVVHQPSQHIFELFDKVAVLARGQLAYFGTPQGALAHFYRIQRLRRYNFEYAIRASAVETLFLVAHELQNTSPNHTVGALKMQQESDHEASYTWPEEVGQKKETCVPSYSERSVMSLERHKAVSLLEGSSDKILRQRTGGTGEKSFESVEETPFPAKEGRKTSGCNWLRRLLILFKLQFMCRFREPGYVRSLSIIFLIMGAALGFVYFRVVAKLAETQTLPLHPVLPLQDAQLMDLPINDFTFDIHHGDGQIPQSFLRFSQIVLSFFLFGMDGKGDYSYLDIFYNGIDGNGSLPPFDKIAALAKDSAQVIPCLHEKLGLSELYPSTATDRNTLDPLYPAYIEDTSEFLLQSYQVFDWVVNHDWTSVIDCLVEKSSAVFAKSAAFNQYLCVFQKNPILTNSATCLGLPAFVLERELGNFNAYLATFDPNLLVEVAWIEASSRVASGISGVATGLFSLASLFFKPSETTTTTSAIVDKSISQTPWKIAVSVPPLKKTRYTWEAFNKMVPIHMPIATLIGLVLSPKQDLRVIEIAFAQVWENMEKFFHKLAPEKGCILHICKFIRSIPVFTMAFLLDSVQHCWTTMNVCGLLFVISALVGVWSLETALTFSLCREKMNKDAFNGTSRRWEFLLSRLAVDLIFQLIPVLILSCIVYFMAGLPTVCFWKYCVAVALICWSASGLCSAVSAGSATAATSLVLSSSMITVLLLLSGFVLRTTRDAAWYKIVGSASMFRSGYAALILSQFPEGHRFGLFTQWIAADFFGGVRIRDLTYAGSCCTLFLQGSIWRLLTLALGMTHHKTMGLENA